MSRRTLSSVAALLAVALCPVRAIPAQASSTRAAFVPISSYDDDPFAADSVLERLARWTFGSEEDGGLVLATPVVDLEDESRIYRADPNTGQYFAFAWNPWALDLRKANAEGDFAFPDEPRFPLHKVERDAEGRVVLKDGLQLWLPQDLHRGLTTGFEAAHAAKLAAELWSGRDLTWGDEGRLEINAHAFIDFNAFYSPTAKALFFGVVPHRLPGEPRSAPVKMFETVTSSELVTHEAGHAILVELKPNRDLIDFDGKVWSESFSDQLAMWASLRDPDRTRALVEETNGNLAQSNSLTAFGEAFAALVGQGTGLRDAFHAKKISETAPQWHARSEVLTGAAYRLFVAVYGRLRREYGAAEALAKSGRILGTFLVRAADFTPEEKITLEDVGKAYLKVDKELYDGRYHAWLVDEFVRREIFDPSSLTEWIQHEEAMPDLRLPAELSDDEIDAWLRAQLDALGIGADFGLTLQSVTRVDRFRVAVGPEPKIVRVQLTLGRGEGATPLGNYGVLVFRPNGTLADYHAPLAVDAPAPLQRGARSAVQAEALAAIADARRMGLDGRGAPLSIVRDADGQVKAEARVLRGDGLDAYVEVFSVDHPEGERREVLLPPVPAEQQIPIPEDVLE